MDLKKRIQETIVRPLPGDDITELKKAIIEFAINYKCRIKFHFNTTEYICDAEGNIAKLN